MRKIIIVNPFGIGDVLFSMPIVTVLKRSFPGAQISYICNRRAYDLLKMHPDLNRIYVFEKDEFRDLWRRTRIGCAWNVFALFRELRGERFDLAVDLSLGGRYGMYFQMIGVRRRIGFDYRRRGRFLTDRVTIDGFSGRHAVEYYLDIVRLMGLNIKEEDALIAIYLSPDDIRWAKEFLRSNGMREGCPLAGVIPGCGASWGADAKYRRWSTAGFARVIDALYERHGTTTILFGSASEVGICEQIIGMVAHKPINACGKTTIGQFAALLKECSIVVTNDGGPLHIASSVRAKTVSLFGPVDERVYGPYPKSERHITVTGSTPCRPCYQNFKYVACPTQQCLRDITPEAVLDAVDRLLRTP